MLFVLKKTKFQLKKKQQATYPSILIMNFKMRKATVRLQSLGILQSVVFMSKIMCSGECCSVCDISVFVISVENDFGDGDDDDYDTATDMMMM